MKIKGFTISEVMIGLLISSVVTATVTQLWVQTNTLVHTFNAQQNVLTDQVLGEAQIELDFYTSKEIHAVGGQQFQCHHPVKGDVLYSVQDRMLIRSEGDQKDTLYKQVLGVNITTLCSSTLVDSLSIQMEGRTINLLPKRAISDHLIHCSDER